MSVNRPSFPSPYLRGDAENPQRGRLLRVAASCPRCGARPALRVAEETARTLYTGSPGARIGTYQCQRRGCGTIYDLFASDCLPEGDADGRP